MVQGNTMVLLNFKLISVTFFLLFVWFRMNENVYFDIHYSYSISYHIAAQYNY